MSKQTTKRSYIYVSDAVYYREIYTLQKHLIPLQQAIILQQLHVRVKSWKINSLASMHKKKVRSLQSFRLETPHFLVQRHYSSFLVLVKKTHLL